MSWHWSQLPTLHTFTRIDASKIIRNGSQKREKKKIIRFNKQKSLPFPYFNVSFSRKPINSGVCVCVCAILFVEIHKTGTKQNLIKFPSNSHIWWAFCFDSGIFFFLRLDHALTLLCCVRCFFFCNTQTYQSNFKTRNRKEMSYFHLPPSLR